MIDKSIIARIMEAAQVEEVVGDFVNLKKRGAHYVSLCPFHNEKTPSFVVSPGKGIYKCFGCGKAGNAVTFLQDHEGMNYPEALRFLGSKYGVEVAEQSAEDKQRYDAEESLYVVNTFAQRHYTKNLFETEEGRTTGLTYFKERGYREETIRKFQLGFALESGSDLTSHALDQGQRLEMLKELGLTREKDGRRFDFFRGRVIFPIHHLSGKVAAFGGRTMLKDSAKYINSQESPVYSKSKLLYGAYQGRGAIRSANECILVEGYTDVISLHQNGIENVVASSGTSLTEDQVRLIKRFAQNVLILFDGDAAGIKASLRGVDMLLQGGLNVKVAVLPDGEDPDSLVQKLGATEFTKFMEKEASDFVIFKLKQLLQGAGDSPAAIADVINDIVGSIAQIPDPIKRSLYIKECSNIMRVEERLLINELNRLVRNSLYRQERIDRTNKEDLERVTRTEKPLQPEMFTQTGEPQERDIIRVLLEFGDEEYEQGQTVAQFVIAELGEVTFGSPIYEQILSGYAAAAVESKSISANEFVQHPNEDVRALAIELLTEKYQISSKYDSYDILIMPPQANFRSDTYCAVKRYQLWITMRMIDENRKRLQEASDFSVQADLQKVRMTLMARRAELAEELATVVHR